jgi:hypothetical protein
MFLAVSAVGSGSSAPVDSGIKAKQQAEHRKGIDRIRHISSRGSDKAIVEITRQ